MYVVSLHTESTDSVIMAYSAPGIDKVSLFPRLLPRILPSSLDISTITMNSDATEMQILFAHLVVTVKPVLNMQSREGHVT